MMLRVALRMTVGYLSLAVACACSIQAQTTHQAKLTMQLGHGGEVLSAAFSPDGKHVLTGGSDAAPRLWETATGKELRRFESQGGMYSCVTFSRDGRLIWGGSRFEYVQSWDLASGKQLNGFRTGQFLTSRSPQISTTSFQIALSPDSRILAIATGFTSEAILVDSRTGEKVQEFKGHTDLVTDVAFSPDGRAIATASKDKTIKLWNTAQGEAVRTFRGHLNSVESISFSPDGQYLLTGSADKTARLWDVNSGKTVQLFRGHSATVSSVAFSPDAKLILTGSNDNTARLWDRKAGTIIRKFAGHKAGLNSVAFSPDGKQVLTSSSDGTARLWDLASGREIKRFEGHSDWIRAVSVSPHGSHLAFSGTGNAVRLWNVNGGVEEFLLEGHSGPISSLAFSPDGGLLLTGSLDKTARIWSVADGKLIKSYVGYPAEINSVAFSPDGKYFLTGGKDNTAREWDSSTGLEVKKFEGHTDEVTSLAFSRNGHVVLTGSNDQSVRLWDATTGKEVRKFVGDWGKISSVAFSPDGNYIAAASQAFPARQTRMVWETATGRQVLNFSAPIPSNAIVFSPDGKYLLIGDAASQVAIYDAATWKESRSFTGHDGPVTSIAVSPDSRFVLSGSLDNTVRLWDFHTGQTLLSLFAFNDGSWAAMDPEGRYDSSDPDNSSSIYWVTDNLRTIDLGQLKQAYYTPGLLGRVLRRERLPDVSNMNSVALPPALSLLSDFDPVSGKLDVSLRNDGGGVGKLLVKVNGRLVRTMTDLQIPPENQSVRISIDLRDAPFERGENRILITAYDSANRIQSQDLSITVMKTATAKGLIPDSSDEPVTQGKFFAIIVGTSTFGDRSLDLMFPSRDAARIAAGLKLGVNRLYGSDKTWIRLLSSEAQNEEDRPTKKNIQAAFDRVRKEARPEDTLVVYLSGHGVMSKTQRDRYYYLTEDARTLDIEGDPAVRDVSTVSSDELFEWLSQPTKTMPLKEVVILDTCASGAAGETLTRLAQMRVISPDQRRAIELLKDSTGTFILLGSAADSPSYEASKFGEGLLTYALLEGMRGKSLDDGSRLGVLRWFEDASEEVPLLAKTIGGIQKPLIAAPMGRGFPIALLTPEDRAKITLETPKPELTRVACENESGVDPLHLCEAIREEMRSRSYGYTRGEKGNEVPVIYLDAVNESFPDALMPRVVYSVSPSTITARVRIVANEKVVAEATVQSTISDLRAVANTLSNKIESLASSLSNH